MLRWILRCLVFVFVMEAGVLCLGVSHSWAAGSRLCHPCTSSYDCDAGGVCVGGPTGSGYCTQACSAGNTCPTGFQCTWLGPGLSQCVPDKQGCFATCNDQQPCPTGFQCASGRCHRTGGGQQGDFCDDKAPCIAGYHCLTNQHGASRCAKRCGPPPGTAGSPCDQGKCDAGLSCVSYGSGKVCAKVCQSSCDANQQCRKIGQDSICACTADKDCASGEICNKGFFGFQGACIKDPFQGKPAPCATGLSCQPFTGQGYLCLPEKGVRSHGMVCSGFLPCQQGLRCFQHTSQTPPLCYSDCMTADTCQSQGLGKCDFIGRTGQYCFCAKDQDCAQGNTCQLIPDSPFQHGLCRPGANSTCSSDAHCPAEFVCQQGKCALPPKAPMEPSTEKNPSEPPHDASGPVPPEPRTTPDISMDAPVKEAATQTEPKPEHHAADIAQESKPEPAQESGAGKEPVTSGDDIKIEVKACGCGPEGELGGSAMLLLLVMCFLVALRQRIH